jgi:hypothetical protein
VPAGQITASSVSLWHQIADSAALKITHPEGHLSASSYMSLDPGMLEMKAMQVAVGCPLGMQGGLYVAPVHVAPGHISRDGNMRLIHEYELI